MMSHALTLDCRGQRELPEYMRSTYIAMEDARFDWEPAQVQEFDRMWEDGISLESMSAHFNRDADEIAILVMDRKRKGMIEPRTGGIFGTVKAEKPVLPTLTKDVYLVEHKSGLSDRAIERVHGLAQGSLKHRKRKWGLA